MPISSSELLAPVAATLRSALLDALARENEAQPLAPKFLVAPSPAEGRELLHALARTGTAWVGWTPLSLRQLALDLATPRLSADGVHLADDFDVVRLLDEAIDAAAAADGATAEALAAPGFRGSAHRAVRSLRAAGIDSTTLLGAAAGSMAVAVLAEVLAAYERALATSRLEDRWGVLRRAALALEADPAALPDGRRYYLLPGLDRSGLAGALLEALRAATSVMVLGADPVVGLEAPAGVLYREAGEPTSPLSFLHAPGEVPDGLGPFDLGFFAAATPADELREVLRRILAKGLAWDQVEIVTTDPYTYGPALDALAGRLGIPVTHARGLSSERTRVGRAVSGYLQWVAEDFPADRLRVLLEAGDVAPPSDAGVSGAALASRLRRLRIGWGWERYLSAVDRALHALAPIAGEEDDDAEERAAARAFEQQQLNVLREMLGRILAAAPAAPDRLRAERARTTPAAIATGLLALLDFVPVAGSEVEATTRQQLRHRLERAKATLTRETGWEAALAALRAHLELQVAAQHDGSMASWTSTGGALHLADVASGGLTGRPVTFVVGLDSTRTTTAASVDPLLSDRVRRALNQAAGRPVPALLSSAERIQREKHALAALLARLRGEVIFSYSAWDATEGRAVSPAPELLQAFRVARADPHLGYQALHETLAGLACAVPADGVCLDASDVWMDALASGRVLRDGRAAVRASFTGLERGIAAGVQRTGATVTAYHGRIEPDAAREAVEAMTFSPSRLETLGTCPRKFYYRYLLRLRPSGDATWDPEVWLDAAARGTLLHAVYERTLEAARTSGIEIESDGFEPLVMQVFEREAAAMRDRVPPPSERIFEQECQALRDDVAVFVEMLRVAAPAWVRTELAFPEDGGGEVEIDLGAYSIRVQGKIDRVDEPASGRFVVIDYKAGSPRRYRISAPFDGGRRIQHVVYLLAAEQMLGGEATAMQYHFPTVTGERHVVEYPREVVDRGRRVLRTLIDGALEGLFVATGDASDCAYCDFAPICRARKDKYGKVTSPAAAWSKSVGLELPEYRYLKSLRESDAALDPA